MHDALHARFFRRLEHPQRILNGNRMLKAGHGVIEAHPIGVVKNFRAAHGFDERGLFSS